MVGWLQRAPYLLSEESSRDPLREVPKDLQMLPREVAVLPLANKPGCRWRGRVERVPTAVKTLSVKPIKTSVGRKFLVQLNFLGREEGERWFRIGPVAFPDAAILVLVSRGGFGWASLPPLCPALKLKFIFMLALVPTLRTDSFRGFVDYCLQKIPQERPSSAELLRVTFQISSRGVDNKGELLIRGIATPYRQRILDHRTSPPPRKKRQTQKTIGSQTLSP